MMNVENCINLALIMNFFLWNSLIGLNPDENEGCALSILRAQKSLKHQRYEKEVGRLYK